MLMKISLLARAPRRSALALALFSLAALPCVSTFAQSDADAAKASAAAAPASPKPSANPAADTHPLPPLPADAHTQQSITLDGKKLNYAVTVGTLIARDADGKAAGQVVYTAYTVDAPNRPVTFAFNGGPGAASVYLNFGAIGPKHLNAGNEGDSPSDPATLIDNQGTWLDFTDLVFIDPVSTGFSRAVSGGKPKAYHGFTGDLESVGEVIRLWTTRNNRWLSPKFIAGESYGTVRAAALAEHLQTRRGMFLNGIIL